MNKFKTTVNTVIMVAGLLGSSVALAQQPEQVASPMQLQNETEQNISSVTEQLVNDFQQQLGNSIKQQVSLTLQSLTESVKQMMQ